MKNTSMRVLLVEDSATVAAYVASILGGEQDIQLLPVASSAEAGVQSAVRDRPDVVLMDMKLPDHDGIWAIEQIMAEAPCPIVVLSGHLSSREGNLTFDSLRAGAVDVLAKPAGLDPHRRAMFRQSLVSTVRLMSEAVVVRRRSRAMPRAQLPAAAPFAPLHVSPRELEPIRYVLIGASTGGPELLFKLLSGIGTPFPLPIFITQHTLEGFDESLASWLSVTGHQVKLAREGEKIESARVFLAPAEMAMQLSPGSVQLSSAKRGAVDSIDTMFASAAQSFGAQCLGILLSGMGKDGAQGMRTLCDRGALTVAQSAETCVVSSMPDAARSRFAVRHVLSPDAIVALLRDLAAGQRRF